jgi:hypothetical protein
MKVLYIGEKHHKMVVDMAAKEDRTMVAELTRIIEKAYESFSGGGDAPATVLSPEPVEVPVKVDRRRRTT